MTPQAPVQIAVYAVDPQRVASFYRGVAGLDVVEEEGGFVTLGSDFLEVHVVRVPADLAESIEIARPPLRRTDSPVKVSFAVASIASARAAASALGGMLDGTKSEWAWRGELHCDGHDPEGNVFQVRQPL